MGKFNRVIRRRAAKQRKPQPTVTATLAIGDITPVCPGSARKALDGEIFAALKALDTLVRDMRANLALPPNMPEDERAIRFYLIYLSLLVDVLLTDLALSATHNNDVAILMKLRILVEYAAKARYFSDNPDYALYMMTVNLAESALEKVKLSGRFEPNTIADHEKNVVEKKQRYARVAHLGRKSFFDILKQYATTDEYAWLYGAPSALIHGDPEGIQQVLEIDEATGSVTGIIEFAPERINAMMVDAGANTAEFCDVFVRRFHANDQQLGKRLTELQMWFRRLILKHPHGRDEEALEKIREELKVAQQARNP